MRFSSSAVLCALALTVFEVRAPGETAAAPASQRASLPALSGPGLVVRLRDKAHLHPNGGELLPGVVHDYDLQQLVKQLHAAKAQGIAINGVRLNANTSIRAVGPTIHIGLRPVSHPYTVEAVGDSKTLQRALTAPDGFAHSINKKGLGPTIRIQRSGVLRLPGSR